MWIVDPSGGEAGIFRRQAISIHGIDMQCKWVSVFDGEIFKLQAPYQSQDIIGNISIFLGFQAFEYFDGIVWYYIVEIWPRSCENRLRVV